MRCEVVAIGTELLLGQIVDTNSAWIGAQLAQAGIDSYFQTKVGDNLARIVGCIRQALERSDAVILCGGLGPTQDDITREAIAEVMGVPLVRSAELAERIRALFAARGREMAANNLRQADVPEGASAIPEMPGTAPGLICPVGAKVIYAVPGVPHEMQTMLRGTVLPDLQRRAGVSAVIRSRVLRTWGHTESGLAELLAPRMLELDVLGNPTLAFQASGIEGIKVRITAKAGRRCEGRCDPGGGGGAAQAAARRDRVRHRRADHGIGGGRPAARARAHPGARRIGERRARGDPPQRRAGHRRRVRGARWSPTRARSSSRCWTCRRGRWSARPPRARWRPGCASCCGADVGLATTGVAGPDEQDGQPVGTVFLGLALGEHVEAREVRLPGDPDRVRQYAVISVLDLLRRRLLGN